MREITVDARDSGQRLDRYLNRVLDQAPGGFLYKMIRRKNITLNGGRCAGNERLAGGDRIRLYLSEETIRAFSGPSAAERARAAMEAGDDLLVLYEDRDVMFVNKRAGELSQKASKDDVSVTEKAVAHALRKGLLTEEDLRTCRPSVCNRLDRNTSGILAIGFSQPGLRCLSDQFRRRSMRKYYLCLVKGEMKAAARLDGYLAKDEKTNRVWTAPEPQLIPEKYRGEARRIVTEYRPLAVSREATLLEVHLVTGRSHQIRAHLAMAGHPVLGDPKYGDEGANRFYRERCGVTGQLLHAWRLEFPSGEEEEGLLLESLCGRSVTAPLPESFLRAVRAAGLDAGCVDGE